MTDNNVAGFAQLEHLKILQDEYRTNPAKLAAAIAENIRLDMEPNISCEDRESSPDDHCGWKQSTWMSTIFDADHVSLVDVKTDYPSDSSKDGKVHWNTIVVSCPTTACVGGWATALAGYPAVVKDVGFVSPDITIEEAIDGFRGSVVDVYDCLVDGKLQSIASRAGELLKLNLRQWTYLFDGDRSQDQVLEVLDMMAKELDWEVDEEGESVSPVYVQLEI